MKDLELYLILSRFFRALSFQTLCFYGFYSTLENTKSALLTGLIGLFLYLPTLFLNFKAADIVDRAKKIGKYYSISLFLQILTPLLILIFDNSYSGIILVIFLSAIIRSFRSPLYYRLLKSISKKSELIAKYNTLCWQFPLIFSPLFVNILSSFENYSLIIVLTCIFFQIMSFILSLKFKKIEVSMSKNKRQNLIQNFKSLNIFENKKLYMPLFSDTIMASFLGLSIFLPYLLLETKLDPQNFGYLKSLFHFGGFSVVLLSPKKLIFELKSSSFSIILMLWISSLSLFLISNSLLVISFIILSLGIIDGVSAILREKLIFIYSDLNNLGKVSSINSLLISTGDELGEFNTGLLIESFGFRSTLILNIFTCLYLLLYFRILIKKNKINDKEKILHV